MNARASAEKRKHARHPLTTSVQFYHGPSQRTFPGRCADISTGGLMMYVPAAAPVQPGQPIRLTIGSLNRPEFARLSERPIGATIIRVDRQSLLKSGHLAVGVRFDEV
jgi:c-di-GMP-binding flagellar brake protein YcgR